MSTQPPKKDPKSNAKASKEKDAADAASKNDAAKGKNKPKKGTKSPSDKEGLAGFNISIDAFGTVHSNLPVDDINRFLDKRVEDRKLNDREGPHADDSAGPGENA